MEFLGKQDIKFEMIAQEVERIADTEKSYSVDERNSSFSHIRRRLGNIDNYSDYGLGSMGRTVKFPSAFLQDLHNDNEDLANKVLLERLDNYFRKNNEQFVVREFEDKIRGVVSNKYNFFDDKQVTDILSKSVLADKTFTNTIITPERLHLRCIDGDRPFRVNGDDSDLFFCYFINNSMVGQSSFRVQLGLFRFACTNGLIVPVKEFQICKQVHRGNKDIVAEFNQSVAFLDEKREQIQEMMKKLSTTPSALEDMKEEFKKDYLAKKLSLSKKDTEKVIDLYTKVYGGKTKWDLISAITEFARDTKNIDKREVLEKKALLVA